ncbi:hypothetical protein [Clostridium sp. 001]|uniref:hypothetical protein n=1 Tax=Clostridium sp. 001 TaxID=1970093 RepID=UPI001C2CBD66|nr:hypothetical protein [Clostridium sp. 001]
MALSASIRKRRNQEVTAMLKNKCGIKVTTIPRNQATKKSDWFIPTRKGEGELKIIYK